MHVDAQSLRADFLRGKSQDEIIKSFNALTTEQKSALWVEKMEQLITQNLPSENSKLIKQMRDSHLRKDLSGFKTSALNLAEITPEEDFIEMFVSLSDYNFNGKFTGKTSVSETIISEINAIGLSQEIVTGKKRECNCRWTCSMYASYSSNCEHTIDGCGFFGSSPCDGHI